MPVGRQMQRCIRCHAPSPNASRFALIASLPIWKIARIVYSVQIRVAAIFSGEWLSVSPGVRPLRRSGRDSLYIRGRRFRWSKRT